MGFPYERAGDPEIVERALARSVFPDGPGDWSERQFVERIGALANMARQFADRAACGDEHDARRAGRNERRLELSGGFLE